MPRKLQHILGTSATRPVFVIGTGRSGTHWLGHSLIGHPEVRATIEVEPMFGLSVRMALDAAREAELFDRLVAAYESQLSQCHTRIYLDKSHPNIWIAEKCSDITGKLFRFFRHIDGIHRANFSSQAYTAFHTRFLFDENRIRFLQDGVAAILDHLEKEETIEGAPYLKTEHLAVFDCAFKPAKGSPEAIPLLLAAWPATPSPGSRATRTR